MIYTVSLTAVLNAQLDAVQTLRACSLLFWGMKHQVWLRVWARV